MGVSLSGEISTGCGLLDSDRDSGGGIHLRKAVSHQDVAPHMCETELTSEYGVHKFKACVNVLTCFGASDDDLAADENE